MPVTGSKVTAVDPTRPVIGIGAPGGTGTGITGGNVITPPTPAVPFSGAGYRVFTGQLMPGNNPGCWEDIYPQDDVVVRYIGINTSITNATLDTGLSADDIWSATAHSSFGNKINMFKYDSTTQLVTRPTPGASGPPNNWSDFKTKVVFHPTEALLVGCGEVATILETATYTSGDIWTKSTVAFSAQYPTNVFGAGFNKEGTHFSAGGNQASVPTTVAWVWTYAAGAFTKIATPFTAGQEPGNSAGSECRGIAYNPAYQVVAYWTRNSGGTILVPVYKYAGSVYTRISADVCSATGGTGGVFNAQPICWSADGLTLYVGNNTIGTAAKLRAFRYNPSNDTFTAINVTETSALLTDTQSLAGTPDNKYLLVLGASVCMQMFKIQPDGNLSRVRFTAGQNPMNDTPAGGGAGIAVGHSVAIPFMLKTGFERLAQVNVRNNATQCYQFNEASGSILDSLAGAFNLTTIVGSPTYAQAGKRFAGSAVLYNGAEMTYRTTEMMGGAGAPRSGIFMVVKPTTIAGSDRTLYCQGASADATKYSEIYISAAGELGWRGSNGSGNTASVVTSGLGLVAGTWYAIFVRQDWGSITNAAPRFWINGVEWTGTLTTAVAGTAKVSDWFNGIAGFGDRNGVGARRTTTTVNFFIGYVDDMVIFGNAGPGANGRPDDLTMKTLTEYALQASVTETYTTGLLAFSPIHYNRLIDWAVAATNLMDDSRDPSTTTGVVGGTWIGGANTVAPGTLRSTDKPFTGQTSYAMVFNGTTQFIDLLASTAIPTTSRIGTMIAWFKGIPGTAGFVYGTWTDTLQQGMGIRVNSDGTVAWVLRRSSGATNEVSITTNAAVNSSWHMAAVVCDNVAATNVLYIDGVAVATTTVLAGTATAADWWNDITAAGTWRPTIGARRTGAATISDPYAGAIAECAILNRALTALEVAALYALRAV